VVHEVDVPIYRGASRMKVGFKKGISALAALMGLSAVVAGALGAHPPDGFFPSGEGSKSWNSAVIFQMFHVLAILGVVGLGLGSACWIRAALLLFIAGSLLFSGSIYALALGGPGWLGPVTPLGGLALMGGWGCLFVGVLRERGLQRD